MTRSGHSVSHVLRSNSAFAQVACMVRGLSSGQSCTDAPSASVLASASLGDPGVARAPRLR
jgi:hypothetical protein